MKTSTYNVIFWSVILAMSPIFYYVLGQNDFRNSTPEQRAKEQTEWMRTQLKLDSAVVSKVYDINLKYARKNQSIMTSDVPRSEKMQVMKANSGAKDEELQKIFTMEQFTLYQQKKEEMRKQRMERMHKEKQDD